MEQTIDTRFLEILQEAQERDRQMIVHRDVLQRGPFWQGMNNGSASIKNRYGDVVISNVTSSDAEEIAGLLNDITSPAPRKSVKPSV